MRSEFKERTMSFAQNIQYLRKLRGITQEELSDLLIKEQQSTKDLLEVFKELGYEINL